MESTDPEIKQASRPAAVLEKTSAVKKWLLGIAGVAIFGVSVLLVHSGEGQQKYKSVGKENKVRERTAEIVKDTVNGHEWVDLGLTSGLKWATYNVGSGDPTEFGNYYAWGETEPKKDYLDINSLTHRKDFYWLIRHDIINEDGILTKEHDVARIVWGEPWRMPTDEDFEELIAECDWLFTDYNGTPGYLVTGPNKEAIFLVASGFKQESEIGYPGEYGDYWSSTVVPELIGAACSLGYGPTSFGRRRYARFVGRTIRAVID